MSKRKLNRSRADELVDLELSMAQRRWLLTLASLPEALRDRLEHAPRATVWGVGLSLLELRGLAQLLRERAAHSGRRRVPEALRQILEKIEHLCQRFAADEPRTSGGSHQALYLAQSVNFREWAERMLVSAIENGVNPALLQASVKLSKTQRETILQYARLGRKLTNRLTLDADGPRTIHFTASELAQLCTALSVPLAEAEGQQRTRLLKAIEKISAGLHLCLAPRPPRVTRRQPASPKTAYQLRVVLQEVRPAVWRSFQTADCTLNELHLILQLVMGWENAHLYAFETRGVRYTSPEAAQELGYQEDRQTRLSDLARQGQRKFTYLYDFGDGWRHLVQIESIFQPEARAEFPLCLEGEQSCPPEDVGGPPGYETLLRILNNPHHEEHRARLEWCGGWFDPDAFDLELTNQRLARLCGRLKK